MRLYINILATLAFILVGISPACAFISGESAFMEICTANGIERVAVNEDMDPSAPDQDQDHAQKPDCGFCFTQTHQKTFQTASLDLSALTYALKNTNATLHSTHIERAELSVQNPRGPPLPLL